jgi:hypothetical protein
MSKPKFPKWFSPYSPPYQPTKPQEEFLNWKCVATVEVTSYSYPSLDEVLEKLKQAGATNIRALAKTDCEGYVETISLEGCVQVTDPNPNYKAQVELYNKNMLEYKKQLGEWKEYKKEHDEYEAKRNYDHKLKLFKKLKKEFEGENV